MSRFLCKALCGLTPYTPGEQPGNKKLIKLNTNESPYPPAPSVIAAAQAAASRLNLYSDPATAELRRAAARLYGVDPENIIAGNGSDEILYFAYAAFAGNGGKIVYPDISYGFYPVFAEMTCADGKAIPLREDFTVCADDYSGADAAVVIANPNAPTGISLPLSDIERIVRENPDNIVIIDEAYVDFGGVSALPLTDTYDNLLIIKTFSKSRSLAGARLGFGIGNKAVIADLEAVRNSVNPYNVNSMTQAAGIAACNESDYYGCCCDKIIATRDRVAQRLTAAGFRVLPSSANFIFCAHENVSGADIAAGLRSRGILVRRFDLPRIRDFLRISIGTDADMDTLVNEINDIIKEAKL